MPPIKNTTIQNQYPYQLRFFMINQHIRLWLSTNNHKQLGTLSTTNQKHDDYIGTLDLICKLIRYPSYCLLLIDYNNFD